MTNIEPDLSIKQLESEYYLFESRGCSLTHFAIWEKHQQPTDDNWYEVYPDKKEKDYYSIKLSIKNDKGIYFHVYYFESDENKICRGKYFLSPDYNYNDKLKKYKEEIESKCQEKLKKLQDKMEKILLESEQMKNEKNKEIEEHKDSINKVTNEIKNLENNLINNYEIKIRRKTVDSIYEKFKLLDFNNMIPKKDIIKFIDKKQQEILETMIKNKLEESKHFNILVLGKAGKEKSTLINSILKLDEYNEEGLGLNTLSEFREYTSNERPGLRLIDLKGVETLDKKQTFKNVIEYIDNISELSSDKLIHCIWYCIDREKEEENSINELKNIFETKKIPIIFVLTNSYDEEEGLKRIEYLKNFGINDAIAVLAKKKIIKNIDQEIEIKPRNLEKLIKLSFNKSKNYFLISFINALKEKLNEKTIKFFEGANNNIINSLLTINKNTNNIECNENYIFKSIVDYFNQIISEYIGEYESKETFTSINQYISKIFHNLDENEEVNHLIKYYKNDFEINFLHERDKIILKYKIYFNEIYFSLINNILKKIEKMVINEVLFALANHIYSDYNKSLMKYIVEEMNNRKENELDINIPDNLYIEIQNRFNNIYKCLGEISEETNENEKEKNESF